MAELSKTPTNVSPDPGYPPATGQFAQLTYTSYDDGSGRGGWRIKQVAGELTAVERDALIERIPTTFDLEPRLPEFPTEDQIAARPARLSYAPLAGAGAYWHTVDAGRDATGRPGNVFAHVALDRRPVTLRHDRPIARWGSADWLRPYGAVSVSGAQLAGSALPEPNPLLEVDKAVEFLIGENIDRQGVFRVLIDAVSAALTGGPAVVLLTDDDDVAARWIAAVSHFLPAVVAQELSWTTHDRPEYARIDVARGTQLIAMPRNALGDDIRLDAVVIDDMEEPDLGGLGSEHRTSHGTVTVSRMSVLAEGVLADETLATRVLTRRDEVAGGVAVDAATAVWPLAIAVNEEADLEEFHDDALRAIADEAPDSAASVPWAADLVTRAQLVHPLSLAQLFTRLVTAAQRNQTTGIIATRFLDKALEVQEWSGGPPFDQVPAVRSAKLASLRPAITEWIARLHAQRDIVPDTTTLSEGVRFAEVLDRLGRRDADFDAVRAELDTMLVPHDAGVFWGGQQWPSNLHGDTVSPATRGRIIRPLLMPYKLDDLLRISGDVWMWLFDDPPAGQGVIPVPANPTADDARLYPIAVRAVLSEGHGLRDPDPEGLRNRTAAAIDLALDCTAISDSDCRTLTEELIALVELPVADLISWAQQFPGRMATRALREQIMSGPADLALFIDVARSARTEHRPDPDVVSAATLRWWYREPDASPMSREELLAHTEAVLKAGPQLIAHYAEDLVLLVSTGFLVGQSVGLPWADPRSPVGHLLHERSRYFLDRLPSWVGYLARRQLIDLNWIVSQSFLGSIDNRLAPRTIFEHGDNPVAWADAMVAESVADGSYDGPTSEDALRNVAWPTVRKADDAAVVESFFRDYRPAAREWLRTFRIPGHDSGRRIIRSLNPREDTR